MGSDRRCRRRHGALAVTVFTDSEPSTPATTRTVTLDDVSGSDRHLELRAAEVAGKAVLVNPPDVGVYATPLGSDRHLELRAAEVAGKAVLVNPPDVGVYATPLGSDRHLEFRAAEVAGTSVVVSPPTLGSDRHLEMRAAELSGQP